MKDNPFKHIRKPMPRQTQKERNKAKYTRKSKHKKSFDEREDGNSQN